MNKWQLRQFLTATNNDVFTLGPGQYLPAPEVQLKKQVLFYDNKVDQGKESDFEYPTREQIESEERPESVSLKSI